MQRSTSACWLFLACPKAVKCALVQLGSKCFGDPLIFDNTYYATLLKRPWANANDSMASMIGLPSDHVLPDDPACVDIIQCYARSQDAFFKDFSASYLKLTGLGGHWA